MINNKIKAYRRYLISTDKRLHVFIWAALIITILFTTISSEANSYSSSVILILCGSFLAFVTPFYYFRHLFWKRSSELYFSLPITRKQMFKETFITVLRTYLIPLIIISIVNIGLSMIIDKPTVGMMSDFFPLKSLGVLVLTIPLFTVISAIVTWVLSFANNLIDAILLSIACMLVPLLVYTSFYSFVSSQMNEILVSNIYGVDEFIYIRNLPSFLNPIYCLSVLAGNLTLINAAAYAEINWSVPIIAYMFWLLVGSVSLFYAYRMYCNRKQESSEQRTIVWYGYPLWIHITTVSFLLINLNSKRLQSSLFSVLFIMLAYVAMMFVAQRKIRLRKKHFIGFASVVIIVLLFSYSFTETKGFNRLHEIVATDEIPYMELSINCISRQEQDSTLVKPQKSGLEVVTGIDKEGNAIITRTDNIEIEISNHEVMEEIEKLQEKTVDKAYRYDQNRDMPESSAMIYLNYYEGESNYSTRYKSRQYEVSNDDLEQIYQEFVLRISKDKPKDTNITTRLESD